MCWSARAAVTKYHSLSGLNHRYLFLTLLRRLEVEDQVSARVGPRESRLSGLQMAAFSLCSHVVETARVLFSFSYHRGTHPISGTLPHDFI